MSLSRLNFARQRRAILLLGNTKIRFKLISLSDIDSFHDLLIQKFITVHKI